jgi:hypothetical protein
MLRCHSPRRKRLTLRFIQGNQITFLEWRGEFRKTLKQNPGFLGPSVLHTFAIQSE